VDIIIASLLVPETPVPRKVARLHLICDILHNSAVPLPMAWKFRQEFQARLGIVFDHMSTIYHSFPGRITAETFKKQIIGVLEIWEDWIVFTPEFTKELRDRLDGKTDTGKKTPEAEEGSGKDEGGQMETKGYESKFKSSSFKPATEEAQTEGPGDKGGEDIDGEPVVDDVDGEPLDGGDVDGVAMDDVDGEPLDGEHLDGEPLDGEPLRDGDLDGEPMKGEDLDGEPMDEDVDGVQMLPD
jgi:U2-associated protein SR140